MLTLDPVSFENDPWEGEFPFGKRWNTADNLIVSFLAKLSQSILSNKEARQYPDLITFGFFCRKSNIKLETQKISDLQFSVGWGTLLHVTPSNIPINFAYSFVMGLLSGNSNIVRLPSRLYPQIVIFLKLLTDVLSNDDFLELSYSNKFVQTERDSKKLDGLVEKCDGLAVWGSDETIQRFKQLSKKVRGVEVYFPSRSSSVVLSAQHYLHLKSDQKNNIAYSFYNDTFLVDQNACSSPTNVFWLGSQSEITKAKKDFWGRLSHELKDKYSLDPVARIDKILDVMNICKKEKKSLSVLEWRPDILTINDSLSAGYKLRFGTFAEFNIKSLDQISGHLRDNEQTITTLGVEPKELFKELAKDHFSIVDRIVPIGKALDIGLHWDGKKMMEIFSRKVEVR